MRGTRSNSIAKTLEEQIVTGAIPNGERLDEASLAQEFGVSRTPIREALQQLAITGLVERRPNRGVFVQNPDFARLLNMFEVMAELEAVCGRLAARRITDAGLAELAAANEACRAALAAKDSDAYYRENEHFHRTIYAYSGNPILADETLRYARQLQVYRRMQLHLRGRMTQSMAEHEAVLNALIAGDGEAVAAALRGHVAVQGEKFHHLLATLQPARAAPPPDRRRPATRAGT